MNLESYSADPGVWFRPGIKEDGTEYMQYVFLNTDNIVCIMENNNKLNALNNVSKVNKNLLVHQPNIWVIGCLKLHLVTAPHVGA